MEARSWIFGVLCSYFSLLISEIEIRHCLGEFFLGEFGMVFSLVRSRGKTCHVVSVGRLMVMVTCSGSVLFPHWLLFGRVLSSAVLSVLTRDLGLGVSFGTVGCLHCLALSLVAIRLWWPLGKAPSSIVLLVWTSRLGPGVFSGMDGCLPCLVLTVGSPWAVGVGDVASRRLETALGSYVDADLSC